MPSEHEQQGLSKGSALTEAGGENSSRQSPQEALVAHVLLAQEQNRVCPSIWLRALLNLSLHQAEVCIASSYSMARSSSSPRADKMHAGGTPAGQVCSELLLCVLQERRHQAEHLLPGVQLPDDLGVSCHHGECLCGAAAVLCHGLNDITSLLLSADRVAAVEPRRSVRVLDGGLRAVPH